MDEINTEILIDLVQEHDILWNLGNSDYKSIGKKAKVWKVIARKCGITTEMCKRKWKSLRDSYSRELNKKKTDILLMRSAGSVTDEPAQCWKYREHMDFLREQYLPKKSVVCEESLPATPSTENQEDISHFSPPHALEEIDDCLASVQKISAKHPQDTKKRRVSDSPTKSRPSAAVAAIAASPCIDAEDENYCRSLLHKLSKLPVRQKNEAKLQMMKYLCDIESGIEGCVVGSFRNDPLETVADVNLSRNVDLAVEGFKEEVGIDDNASELEYSAASDLETEGITSKSHSSIRKCKNNKEPLTNGDVKEETSHGDDTSELEFLDESNANSASGLETDDGLSSKSHSNSNKESNEDDFVANANNLDVLSPENHEVLKYIIDLYQKNPILWDLEHPFYTIHSRKIKHYKEIAAETNNQFKLRHTASEIRVAFQGLRKMYNVTLLNSINARHVDQKNVESQLWCFQQLEFLREQELAANKPVTLTTKQLLQLAEIYEQHLALWNKDKHNKIEQMETLQHMLQEVNEQMHLNMTLPQLAKANRHLWGKYREYKHKRVECDKNDEPFKPTLPELCEKLQFLEPFVGPLHCEKCDSAFMQYSVYKAHLAAHEGRLPFTCEFCEKGFKLYTNFEIHVRRHTGEKPFACTHCDMRFAAGTDLKGHESTHTAEKNMVCDICGKAFLSRSSLWTHKNTHDTNRARLPCPQCSKTFVSKPRLREHLNVHAQVRNAVCAECGKSFYSRKTLRQHKRLHDKEKRYQCELCEKKFAQRSGLCSHMRTHQIAGVRDTEKLVHMEPILFSDQKNFNV